MIECLEKSDITLKLLVMSIITDIGLIYRREEIEKRVHYEELNN